MRFNLFNLIKENEVEYDERINEELKNIQILMLLLIKIAFSITLTIDGFNPKLANQAPILYYVILLEMTLEPLLRCIKGTFSDSKEFIVCLIIGCIIAGVSAKNLFNLFIIQHWITVILSIITSIIMYFIYDWSYNAYLRKKEID